MSTIDSAALRAYRLPRIEIDDEKTAPAKRTTSPKQARPSDELAAAGMLFVAMLCVMAALFAAVGLALFR